MTGLKLARRAGVSASYVSLIEHGEKVPSERVAVRLARALGDREDLYRAWAATARMDEQTRRAILALGSGPSTVSPRPAEKDARGISVPLLAAGACPTDLRAPHDDEIDANLVIDGRLLARSGADGLVALRIDAENSRLAMDTVRAGDVVVIDRFDESLAREGLHALRFDSKILVARTRRLDGKLLIVREPGAGEARPAGLAGDEDDVAGRVFGTIVWRARRVGRVVEAAPPES